MNFRLISVFTAFAVLTTTMSPAIASVRIVVPQSGSVKTIPGAFQMVPTSTGVNIYKGSTLIDKLVFTDDGLAVHYLPTIDRIVVDKKTGLNRREKPDAVAKVPVICKPLPASLAKGLSGARWNYAGASAALLGAVGATAFADLTTFGLGQILLTGADLSAFFNWVGAEQSLESAESADDEWEEANNSGESC